MEEAVDCIFGIGAVPQAMRDPRQHDEEGEKRDQREICEVAGVDKSIRINPDRDPLENVEQARVTPVYIRMVPAALG